MNIEEIRALVSDRNNLITKMSLDITLKHPHLPDSSCEKDLYRYRFLLPAGLAQR